MRRFSHSTQRLLSLLFPLHTVVHTCATLAALTPNPHRIVIERHPITTAASLHDPAIRAAIHALKYYDDPHATKLLGTLARELIPEGTYVVTIPLSRLRLRKRGFNQLDRILGHCPTLHHLPILARTDTHISQTKLSKALRKKSIVQSFTLTEHAAALVTHSAAQRLILFDDVVTTGATLLSARRALTPLGLPISLYALTRARA